MATISLTRAETSLLQEAAADAGRLRLAPTLKPASRTRLVGRLLRDALITPPDRPEGLHRLTSAGHRAIGLTPPERAGPVSRLNKKVRVLTLLARDEGATLAELIAAMGWLPHTDRAALSRIRSGGQALAQAARQNTTTAYRILPPAPAARPRSRRKGEMPTQGTGVESEAGVPLQVTA